MFHLLFLHSWMRTEMRTKFSTTSAWRWTTSCSPLKNPWQVRAPPAEPEWCIRAQISSLAETPTLDLNDLFNWIHCMWVRSDARMSASKAGRRGQGDPSSYFVVYFRKPPFWSFLVTATNIFHVFIKGIFHLSYFSRSKYNLLLQTESLSDFPWKTTFFGPKKQC